ncbi:SPOSA6832_02064, partial [Sporobolomyces salmonicolor]
MTLATPESVRAASRVLYRSLLRVALKMPDDHRRALVVFRSRSEFDKSRSLKLPQEIAARQLEGEIYRDQLEVRYQYGHWCSSCQGSRAEGTVKGRSGRNRFMEGPEPSWVRKAQEKEQAENANTVAHQCRGSCCKEG